MYIYIFLTDTIYIYICMPMHTVCLGPRLEVSGLCVSLGVAQIMMALRISIDCCWLKRGFLLQACCLFREFSDTEVFSNVNMCFIFFHHVWLLMSFS